MNANELNQVEIDIHTKPLLVIANAPNQAASSNIKMTVQIANTFPATNLQRLSSQTILSLRRIFGYSNKQLSNKSLYMTLYKAT